VAARPSWARPYFAVVVATLWLLSTPAVAESLAGLTDGGYAPIRRVEDARGATTVVVLGGGSHDLSCRPLLSQ
jgi:hypothetical protein